MAVARLTLHELNRRRVYYVSLMGLFSTPAIVMGVSLAVIEISLGDAALLALGMAAALLFVQGAMLGAFTYAVISSLLGRPIPLWDALREGASRAVMGAGMATLYGFASFAALIPAFLIVMIAVLITGLQIGSEDELTPGAAAVLVAIFMVAQALTAPLFVAWPVAMAEGCGPIGAFARSFALTRGVRPQIALIAAVLALITVAGAVAAFWAAATFGPPPVDNTSPYWRDAAGRSGAGPLIPQLAMSLTALPFSLAVVMTPIVSYFLLSMERDVRDPDGGLDDEDEDDQP
ncbi:MAG: hypothetical protein AAF909_02390 [Pseudomonadota bacterium]